MDSPSVAQTPITHPAVCPICRAEPERETYWVTDSITEAAYICPQRHTWTSKFLAVAA